MSVQVQDYVREYTGHLFFDIPTGVKIDVKQGNNSRHKHAGSRSKPVILMKNGKVYREYPSMRAAAMDQNMSMGAVYNRCMKGQTVYGITWGLDDGEG